MTGGERGVESAETETHCTFLRLFKDPHGPRAPARPNLPPDRPRAPALEGCLNRPQALCWVWSPATHPSPCHPTLHPRPCAPGAQGVPVGGEFTPPRPQSLGSGWQTGPSPAADTCHPVRAPLLSSSPTRLGQVSVKCVHKASMSSQASICSCFGGL